MSGPIEPNVCTDAADAIEELSRPRDEYARTWLELLERIETLPLVDWLRAYVNAFDSSDFSHPMALELVQRTDARISAAADEIERLTRERDEARRMWCEQQSDFWDEPTTHPPKRFATEKGWDCYGPGQGVPIRALFVGGPWDGTVRTVSMTAYGPRAYLVAKSFKSEWRYIQHRFARYAPGKSGAETCLVYIESETLGTKTFAELDREIPPRIPEELWTQTEREQTV
jgi:hypothetical protein